MMVMRLQSDLLRFKDSSDLNLLKERIGESKQCEMQFILELKAMKDTILISIGLFQVIGFRKDEV